MYTFLSFCQYYVSTKRMSNTNSLSLLLSPMKLMVKLMLTMDVWILF